MCHSDTYNYWNIIKITNATVVFIELINVSSACVHGTSIANYYKQTAASHPKVSKIINIYRTFDLSDAHF